MFEDQALVAPRLAHHHVQSQPVPASVVGSNGRVVNPEYVGLGGLCRPLDVCAAQMPENLAVIAVHPQDQWRMPPRAAEVRGKCGGWIRNGLRGSIDRHSQGEEKLLSLCVSGL